MSTNAVRLDPSDNVVTALKTLETGAEVESVFTQSLVPRGHKIASRADRHGRGDA